MINRIKENTEDTGTYDPFDPLALLRPALLPKVDMDSPCSLCFWSLFQIHGRPDDWLISRSLPPPPPPLLSLGAKSSKLHFDLYSSCLKKSTFSTEIGEN